MRVFGPINGYFYKWPDDTPPGHAPLALPENRMALEVDADGVVRMVDAADAYPPIKQDPKVKDIMDRMVKCADANP